MFGIHRGDDDGKFVGARYAGGSWRKADYVGRSLSAESNRAANITPRLKGGQ